jgi:hypothetical protein
VSKCRGQVGLRRRQDAASTRGNHPLSCTRDWCPDLFCTIRILSKLRLQRESIYGAERFEDGASQINKSDMFFRDDGELRMLN